MKVFLFGSLILGFLLSYVSMHSNGLVNKACDTMMLEHGTTVPQITDPPYSVAASSYLYRPSDEVTVTIQANPGTYFEGFLLQARTVPGNEIVGHFIVTDSKSQNLICDKNVNSTVTQSDSSKKSNISVVWVAPASDSSVTFKATIVQSKHTFWVGVASPELTREDGIHICVINSNKQEEIQNDFAEGKKSLLFLPLSSVNAMMTLFAGDVIKCSFTSRNQSSTLLSALQAKFSNNSDTYYMILLAYGPADNGRIQFHSPGVFFSTKTNHSATSNVTHRDDSKHIMVKAHGALMLIAWMTTGSLGMIIARYFKTAAKRPILGKALWFQAHLVFMILTVAATIVSFVLSFVVARGWTYDVSTHASLGCIVMILAFFQPLIGFFRPSPQTGRRYIFNWYHGLSALVMKVLAGVCVFLFNSKVANLFLGFQFIDHRLGWMVKVMGGFVGWEALAITSLEINDLAKKEMNNLGDRKSTEASVKSEVYLLIVYLCGNLAFLIALLVGIGLS